MSNAQIIGSAATRCGRFADATVAGMAIEALDGALADAGIDIDRIEAIFFANALSGLMTGQECVRGQVALRHSRYGGIPTVNVENACASGSSALHLACMAVDSGQYETVAVVGSEKMSDPDRSLPIKALAGAADVDLLRDNGANHSIFMESYAERARGRIERHGWSAADFARVVVKNRGHAVHNDGAQFRQRMTVDEVLASRMITEPLTLPMCSPIGDGAAALVVTAGAAAAGAAAPIRVKASALSATGGPGAGTVVQRASAIAREQCGLSAADVDVIEVHDATASAELEAYEHLGLAAPGEGNRLIAEGRVVLGGPLPVNTSGGLLSRGHPVGATGVMQIVELVAQLRERAGERQVQPVPKLALAQNAGGFVEGDNAAAVITVLEREREPRRAANPQMSRARLQSDV